MLTGVGLEKLTRPHVWPLHRSDNCERLNNVPPAVGLCGGTDCPYKSLWGMCPQCLLGSTAYENNGTLCSNWNTHMQNYTPSLSFSLLPAVVTHICLPLMVQISLRGDILTTILTPTCILKCKAQLGNATTLREALIVECL